MDLSKLSYALKEEISCRSTSVTFADHPHSLIRNTAKDAARGEVKRIIELYESQTQREPPA
jgi:hypothetical protein